MIINSTEFNADLYDILSELRNQLVINKIPLLEKEPKESGNNYQIQCPYHGNGQERKPSAGIRKDTGVFHCFACGETHDLPEVISYCFDRNDMGAFGWQWLLKNFLVIDVEDRKELELDFSRGGRESLANVDRRGQREVQTVFVSEAELDSYRYYHRYWKDRGIEDDDIIELFDLGYDLKTRCITFPVRDIDGNCLFVAKRNTKTKFFNYPEGVQKPLYGLYELSELAKLHHGNWENDVFVCESMIDCILLWQSGHYAVALNGLGNNLQFSQLNHLDCRHLILATDNDEAGFNARDRIRSKVKNKLITEILFPYNRKDVGECTRAEIDNIREWEVF